MMLDTQMEEEAEEKITLLNHLSPETLRFWKSSNSPRQQGGGFDYGCS